jgi:hypothetical protein
MTDRLSGNVGKKLTTARYVTDQKSAIVGYRAAEACNRTKLILRLEHCRGDIPDRTCRRTCIVSGRIPSIPFTSYKTPTNNGFVSLTKNCWLNRLNPLPPNDLHVVPIYIYICRTAPLTCRRCILNIYSTNIRTEYFKHAV